MAGPDETVERLQSEEYGSHGNPPQPADAIARDEPLRYYALLIAVYNLLFGLFLMLYRRSENRLEKVTPLDVAMLGLGTLRMAKMISEDEITTVIRRPLVAVEHGERHPRGRGLRWSVGKLLLCPTCAGTWIAALLTYALHLQPRYTRPLLAVMAASAIEQSSDAVLSLVYADRDLVREVEERRKSR